MKARLQRLYRGLRVRFPGTMKYPSRVARRLLGRGGATFDPDLAFVAAHEVPQGRVFVDVGANVGQSAELMRRLQPDVPIVSFEPHPVNFRRLVARTAPLSGIETVEAGVGDAPGELVLYTPVYRDQPYPMLSSTLREEAAGWIARHAGALYDEAWLRIDEHRVRIVTLDEYDLAPSLIKIDTQGTEDRVLQGAARTIAAHRPLIMVEQSAEDIIQPVLGPMGYEGYHLKDGALHSGAAGWPDGIYLPAERRGAFGLPFA